MPKTQVFDKRYSEVEHISYQIERYETVIRQHLLAQNIVMKEYVENNDNILENGMFKFNTNRKYFDSLESGKIARDQKPMAIN